MIYSCCTSKILRKLFASAFFAVSLVHSQAVLATLPNGRRITPEGRWVSTAPYPFAIAVRPDGRQLAIPCIGFPFSFTIVDDPQSPEPQVRRIPPQKPDSDVEVHTGIVYSSDSRHVYVSSGDSGAVDIYDASTWRRTDRISLNRPIEGRSYAESFAANLVLDAWRNRLYVLDQANWRVVIIDIAAPRLLRSVPTGVNPIALALSPSGRNLYVANSGLFEYRLLPGINRDNVLTTGLRFAPFGYPSRQARRGVRSNGRNIPGLGNENDPRGSSLWTYDLDSDGLPAHNTRPTKLRLGAKIVETPHGVIGGAAPSALAADDQHVFVALAHQDSIAVISADGRTQTAEIPVSPFEGPSFEDARHIRLRGSMPSGLALVGNRLYVTEAGVNAVAVLDTSKLTVTAQHPVGWNPSAIAPSPDNRSVFVVNTKGKGTGPNGGSEFQGDREHSYIGELALGSVSQLSIDSPDATAAVLAANEAALVPGRKLPRLKHVFLIIRENRTFDEVFGDLPGADRDQALARYGLKGWTEEQPGLHDVAVTPNAHALAGRFATSDQFFADSDVSADGHRWIFGVAPTPWMNIAWTSNYGGRRHANPFSPVPGRRALFGGSDAPMPEDEPQFGSLWQHVAGSGLRILNYGEGLEIEGSDEKDGFEPEGQRNLLNAPLPKPVFESTDRAFPTFNLGIPDQHRFAEFKGHFDKQLKRNRLPALVVIRLPNDHIASVRPGDGYPYRASFVADNDLALGKIIEYLSQATIWKDSAVFVTEDDAQGGRDHVDAHRTVLLVASPWVRPGTLSHRHASFVSIQKTIYELLGLGPLNLEDALASDLSDLFFSDSPSNSAPFGALPADLRIFNPALARVAKPKTKAERAALLDCDNPATMRRDAAASIRER